MSAPYKVMAEMQKTRRRTLRGNREVMIVLGGIVIVGMIMLVNTLNKRLNSDNARARQAQERPLKLATAGEAGWHGQGPAVFITISLNPQGQWEVADQGVVSEDGLRAVFAEGRARADEEGASVVVRASISGEEPAKHFIELHRIAQECDMDHITVDTDQPLLESEDGEDDENA